MHEAARGKERAVETMASRPDLGGSALLWFDCFAQLCRDRDIGMAEGPIPWSAIDRWATRHAISDPDDFALLTEAVFELDSIWMAHRDARLKDEAARREMRANLRPHLRR